MTTPAKTAPGKPDPGKPDPATSKPLVTAHRWAVGASVVFVLAVAYIVYGVVQDHRAGKLLEPDTPPAEYLYLDNARVRSYLGQLVNGLPASEKRTLSESEDLAAEVKASGVGLSSANKTSTSTVIDVSPTVADRFYLLLRLLRKGKSNFKSEDSRKWLFFENGDSRKWLFDLNLGPKKKHRGVYEVAERVYQAACKVHEGDFVRINDAHLSLSPYAAVLPTVTYATLNLNGEAAPPTPRVLSPRTRVGRRRVSRYRRLLGKDPRLPFIVRTTPLRPRRGQPAGVTFFLPTRYKSLRNEPSLISGTLTIVGKIVYLNLGRSKPRGSRMACQEKVPSSLPRSYVDRMTVATFVPALEEAPNFVFDNLGFRIGTIAQQVTANMTVAAPVMVVIPIAMYQ
ncbi:MAG: hypothetical protein AABM30_03335 [Actinomycetota bacterium]